ncbi:MAG TPA: molybdopterin oxidoreductase [Thiotrichales bacterium]|nr:molybdopterin oxidoreductase [Thiotrichales bacterium]
MKKVRYTSIDGRGGFYALLGVLGLFILAGLGAAYYMEHNGHWVTGMDNQTVWGLPHVFAVFLIVAASGALNVASIGTVFGKAPYKPLARLSAVLAVALLVGGLVVLLLDLGRPDRLIVAMTYYNFKSIFAWNIILYTGFMGFVAIYLWTMMDRTVRKYYKLAGFAAFIWRLILTTGTGSIFGFLVGRQGYDAAIMAPMFVVMSFSFGLAIFLLVLMAAYDWTGRPLGEALLMRLKNLLGVFVAGALYFVIVFHLTNLYATEHHDWEKFILMGESVHTKVFWLGQVLLGSLVPLGILYSKAGRSRAWIAVASALVILGGFATMWVTIIGGQSFPLVLFPGMEVVSSGYFDDVAYHTYSPSFPELVLGLGGVAVALIAVVVAVKVLNLLPSSLADADVDPHHKG